MRCALLQRRWADEVWGQPARRDGSGPLVETYPAAALARGGSIALDTGTALTRLRPVPSGRTSCPSSMPLCPAGSTSNRSVRSVSRRTMCLMRSFQRSSYSPRRRTRPMRRRALNGMRHLSKAGFTSRPGRSRIYGPTGRPMAARGGEDMPFFVRLAGQIPGVRCRNSVCGPRVAKRGVIETAAARISLPIMPGWWTWASTCANVVLSGRWRGQRSVVAHSARPTAGLAHRE
jgi:hypothetical protein